ncbi:MAG TPA: transporter associated domain-containing protein [Mariprofundaceae bacterium]|nr:transporter associated domain-containing protein [Mariprofundaceae bacterium]
MSKGWQEWLRQKLIERLKPGRTEDELIDLVNSAEAIKSDEQRRHMERMVEFYDTRVREVMIPRSDIISVEINMSLDAVEKVMSESSVTRLPVIDGELDRVLGIIHVWDLFSARVKGESTSLGELIRPCPNVSELERVGGLLTEMREGSHIAIVLDEFGGTAGLVTLSDLLEEIVGSIDEGGDSEEDAEYHRTDNGALEVQARMHVEDLEELLEIELPEGDFDTVGGMIVTELGRIPVTGEQVEVAGLNIHVKEADPRRVIQILIKPDNNN